MILIGILVYLAIAVAASWVLSDGYKIDCEALTLVVFSLAWPFFAAVLVMAYYDEWRYAARKSQSCAENCGIEKCEHPDQVNNERPTQGSS
jgi:hypothetical protein